jgi:hypothetical protein
MTNKEFREEIQASLWRLRRELMAVITRVDARGARLEGVWPLIEYPDPPSTSAKACEPK